MGTLGTLDRYLSDFSAHELGVSPAQSKLVALGVAVAQEQLILLGHKLAHDGSYGPGTRDAWQKEAIKRRLNPAFDRRNKSEAWVHPDTYRVIASAAYSRSAAPAVPAPAASSTKKKPAAVTKSTKRLTPKPSTPPAAKVAQSAPKPAKAPVVQGGTKPQVAAGAGSSDVPVQDLQRVLYRLGWTAKKLKADGKYGPQTTAAWASSSKLRKLDPSISRVSGTVARVSSATYAVLSTASPATAALVAAAAPVPTTTVAPESPSSMVSTQVSQGAAQVGVLDAQKILRALGWKKTSVALDGKFGPKTQGAWAASSKLRKLDPTFVRVDGGTASVSPQTLVRLQSEAHLAPPAPPGTPDAGAPGVPGLPGAEAPSPAVAQPSAVDQAFARSFTSPVLVGDVQRMLVASRKYPAVQVTGTWDDVTQASLLDVFFKEPAFKAQFVAALPQLLLQNGQSLLLLPDQAKVVALGAGLYAQQQPVGPAAAAGSSLVAATMPAPSDQGATFPGAAMPGTPGIPGMMPGAVPTSVMLGPGLTPGPTTLPSPGMPGTYAGGAAQGGGQATDSGGGITPVAVGPDQPAAAAAPSADQAAAGAPAPDATWQAMVQALGQVGDSAKEYSDTLEAAAKQGSIKPEVKAAVLAWGTAVEALKNHVAQLIDGSAPLKAAIESAGPTVGLAGYSGFSELEWGFGSLRGLGVIAEKLVAVLREPIPMTAGGKPLAGLGIVEWVLEAGAALWPKLVQVLGSRVVTAVGVTAMAASGLNDVINADIKAVADGKLSVEQANALKKGSNTAAYLVGGAVVLGGLALWLQHKRKGGSPMSGLRASNDPRHSFRVEWDGSTTYHTASSPTEAKERAEFYLGYRPKTQPRVYVETSQGMSYDPRWRRLEGF